MILRTSLATASMTLLLGCATHTLSPDLPANHPSNPKAAEAPVPAHSQTLAIGETMVPPRPEPLSMQPDMGGAAKHGMGSMDHGTKGTTHETPSTAPGQSAAPSAARWTPTTVPTSVPATNATTYTCPMHPEVLSDNPGRCPQCGMKLVPKKPQGGTNGGHGNHGGH